MQRQFVAQVAALGDLDRVDFADQVRDRCVGRGQLLAVALRPVYPLDRHGLAQFVEKVEREARHRLVGVVVDLGTGHDGHPLVEQSDHRSDHARLGLSSLAQKDHVVPGQDGVLQLGHHGLLETEHARYEALACGDSLGRVAPHLLGDWDRLPAAATEIGQGPRQIGGRLHGARKWSGGRVVT